MVAPYKAAAGIVFFFFFFFLLPITSFRERRVSLPHFFVFFNYSQSSKPFKSSGANRLFGADFSLPK